MAFDGRAGIVDIDEDERTVIFDTYRLKKITGTRVANRGKLTFPSLRGASPASRTSSRPIVSLLCGLTGEV